MRNVQAKVNGNKLYLVIDLSKPLDKQTKRGGRYIAETEGYLGDTIPGTNLKMKLAIWETSESIPAPVKEYKVGDVVTRNEFEELKQLLLQVLNK